MPTNAKAAQIIQAGAPSLSKADEKALCKAFARAVKAWCKRKAKGPAGQFNDEFIGQCQRPSVNLWGRMRMEVPAVALPGGGGGFLFRVARGTGPVAARARGVMRLAGRLTSVTSQGWRRILAGAIGRGMGGAAMFPDAALLVNGPPRRYMPVEVKGPGDTEGPGQFDKYRKLDPKGELAIVSCDTCPGSCSDSGGCP